MDVAVATTLEEAGAGATTDASEKSLGRAFWGHEATPSPGRPFRTPGRPERPAEAGRTAIDPSDSVPKASPSEPASRSGMAAAPVQGGGGVQRNKSRRGALGRGGGGSRLGPAGIARRDKLCLAGLAWGRGPHVFMRRAFSAKRNKGVSGAGHRRTHLLTAPAVGNGERCSGPCGGSSAATKRKSDLGAANDKTSQEGRVIFTTDAAKPCGGCWVCGGCCWAGR